MRRGFCCVEQKPTDAEAPNPWSRYITTNGSYINPRLYDLDDIIDEDTDIESFQRLRKAITAGFRNFKRR
jgi:hypothetical protein